MDSILNNKSSSILLIEERTRKDIIICAPHHTIGGIKALPCPEHPESDENTGLIAREIAEFLSASSIIACNYRIDPNKNLRTDYSLQILHWNPKYLIEIHGHGGKRVDGNKIEISSGNSDRSSYSIGLAKQLKENMTKYLDLNEYEVIGDFNKIHFKAQTSATITYKNWVPFHIEIPPSLRLDPLTQLLPTKASNFIKSLIASISDFCT